MVQGTYFVDSYIRYGYHRNALIEDNSNKE